MPCGRHFFGIFTNYCVYHKKQYHIFVLCNYNFKIYIYVAFFSNYYHGAFINDLYKELHCGIKIGIEHVSIILYADNIVFLSDSEKGLQSMLS